MADIIEFHSAAARIRRIHKGFCDHKNLLYDERNQYLECADCHLPVPAFEGFMILLRSYRQEESRLDRRKQELKELEERSNKALLKATRAVDHAWRSKRVVPVCPHCEEAIFPEDGFGKNVVSKVIALEKRRRR